MKEYREIENTRYHITRVFDKQTTASMLIEQRVLEEKSKTQSLTSGTSMIYNSDSGSIQSKEEL